MAKNTQNDNQHVLLLQLQQEVIKFAVDLQRLSDNVKDANYQSINGDRNIVRMEKTLERIQEQIEAVKVQMGEKANKKDIEDKLEKHYVNNDKFMPVKLIVYGLIALTMAAVLAGLLALVITTPPSATPLHEAIHLPHIAP